MNSSFSFYMHNVFIVQSIMKNNTKHIFTALSILTVFLLQFQTPLHAQGFAEVYPGSLTPNYAGFTAWGDYDNDGDLDILMMGATSLAKIAKIYQNTGAGFTEVYPGSIVTDDYFGGGGWGDYDNDGDLDILIAGTGHTRIYQNTGVGFTQVFTGTLPTMNLGFANWGDYDNDGKLDILITGTTTGAASGATSKIFRNTGSGFTEMYAGSLTGVYFSSVASADYDNDGDIDILITGVTSSSVYVSKIYQNTGSGFSEVYAGTLPGVAQGSAAWGDYDNDGDLDILLKGYNNPNAIAKIYQNTGSGFTEVFAGSLSGSYRSPCSWGDYDNDGDLDILFAGTGVGGYTTRIYQNTGSGFTEVFTGTFPGVEAGFNAWGDYDNDGDLDMILTGASNVGGFIAKIYKNNGTAFNTIPTVPTGLTASRDGSNATFTWNRSSDSQTPQPGLSYNLRLGTSSNAVDAQSPSSNLSNGFRRVVRMGNTNSDTSWTIKNLNPAQTYYWSVQAVDNAFAGSAFSAEHNIAGPLTITASAGAN